MTDTFEDGSVMCCPNCLVIMDDNPKEHGITYSEVLCDNCDTYEVEND